MAWLVLVLSGVLEAVWAVALARSDGLSRPLPSAVFVAALLGSMAGLGYALREIPVGTGYAIWVCVGVAGTALVGLLALGEPATPQRLFFLLLVVVGAIGLKLSS